MIIAILVNSGFNISFIDKPRLNIAISSLSLSSLINARRNPNIIMNGIKTFIIFGIKKTDKYTMLKSSIFKLFIIENSLDICNNQAIDKNIKKTSVQDLKI